MRVARRLALIILAASLTVFAAVRFARLRQPPEQPSSPPDVILVTIDTLRADHLAAYGDARASTPVLDALAQRGTRFAHVVAPAPLTLPSHASLFTALNPPAHGVR